MPINHQESNKRLVKNTLTLYLRMILTVGISFYTTRIILKNLGVSDFGLYNVIAGFISMFYMVTSSMAAATSRFITFELGKNNIEQLKKVFSTSINFQILLSFFIIVIGETIGLWFVNTQMVIESDKLFAANIVYQITVLSFIFELLGIPYYSSIIAHEKIKAFAYMTILNVILKLIIAWGIVISPIDKVVFYALCMMTISLLTQFLYFLYCKHNFEECKYKFCFEKTISKQMFSFGGWSFLSSASSMLRGQGVNILLNLFYGTTINAAYGVARQVDSSVKAFSNNFITALNPQITKSYASGDKGHTINLVYKGTKYSYILLYIIALPIMMESDAFLDLWLVEIPQYSTHFVRLILILALAEVILKPLLTLNNATGDIKMYQIILSISQFAVLPISYLLLKLNVEPYFVMYVTIGAELVTMIPRIIINKKHINITLTSFTQEVLIKLLYITFFSFICCYIFIQNVEYSIIRLFGSFIISTLSIIFTTYTFGLDKKEKEFIKLYIHHK